MEVFVSSLISGMEEDRAAVRRAIERLGHRAVMAEDFGARPDSPQVACLRELRRSDAVVLVLGARYGAQQASGLSATHEEYRSAQGEKPVIIFLKDGEQTPELEQADFVAEVSGWEGGLFRESYTDPQQLDALVTRALHRMALSSATTPMNPGALSARAVEVVQQVRERNHYGAVLHLGVAAGPVATILRPAELEGRDLASQLQQALMFGPQPLFDVRLGADVAVVDQAVSIFQGERNAPTAEVQFWSTGDLRVSVPLPRSTGSHMSYVIEEAVAETVASALTFADWVLGHVDPTERLTHVSVAARVVGDSVMGWRTAAEHAASPNSGSWSMMGREVERGQAVQLSPGHMPRAALKMRSRNITEDLVVLLRRRWRDERLGR
ncbi:DUF4062 domain-containing protein [Solilutibacter tolerans]|uniref:DUF4062 domain-containing protein n=1 Tax=Solilutibacter tolerans TaxID=1604334 RepID=A0A1N6W1U5_9GAMM|nr:DUF4062 domain-containing protein [Lysobacter tolerans]SIQ84101.1 protein of unknown function [Lysobacter tolerans]